MRAARHILEKYKFGIPLVIVAAAEVIYLIAVQKRMLPESIMSLGEDYGQTGLLVIFAHFLIFANTCLFLIELGLFASRVDKLQDKNVLSRVQMRGVVAMLLLVVSTWASGMMIKDAYACLRDGNASVGRWTELLEWHEALSIVIYFLFFVADWCIYKGCSMWLASADADHQSRSEVESFRSDLRLFIFGCDAPGLLGAFFIVVASIALHGYLSHFYWHGVVAGALGMHIIFSQASLAFLSVYNSKHQNV